MKTLILSLIILAPSSVLACAKKVDPKKVMLFVDTNFSDLEIKTAEKAACERGERLVVVPKNFREYTPYIEKSNRALKDLQKNCKTMSPACEKSQSEYVKTQTELTKFQQSQKGLQVGVREALEEIKSAGGKLQQFTISGHDGGGNFGGSKGGFSRFDLLSMMEDYQDINDVKSLLLLGCYTGTQYEVMQWKNIFPKTKLIGGYDGSAPLSDRPQGHQYIQDLLLKEQSLVTQADNKKLMAFVNSNFKGLNNLNAAMYVQCSDGSSVQDYYYGSKKSRQFSSLEGRECMEKRAEMEEISKTIEKYSSGELEIPKDTSGGALRALYNKARTYEHCSELTGVFVDVNAIFNLLFYEGVKESFADFYKDDLKEAEALLESLNTDGVVEAVQTQIKTTEDIIAAEEKDLQDFMQDKEAYFKKMEDGMKEQEKELEQLLNDPANAQFKETIQSLSNNPYAQVDFSLFSNPAFADLYYKSIGIKYSQSLLEAAKQNPEMMIENKKLSLQYMNQGKMQLVSSLESLKKTKKPWVPTAENLKKYSRKEFLDNMHMIHKVLSLNAGTEEQKKTLGWVTAVSQTHLQSFRNPFSWHEFNGKAEAPPQPMRLKDYNPFQGGIMFSSGVTGGTFGGYVGGYSSTTGSGLSTMGSFLGGMAGGFVGGSQSGTLNGGFQLENSDSEDDE